MSRASLFLISFLISVLSMAHAQSRIQRIEVSPPEEGSTVLDILSFRVGDSFEPSSLKAGQVLLEATERYESATLRWDSAESTIFVNVVVLDFFDGLIWLGDKIPSRRTVESLCFREFEQRPLSQDRQSEIVRCVSNELRSQGYLDVEVQLSEMDQELSIDVKRGPPYRVSRIQFEGARDAVIKQLTREIGHKPTSVFEPSRLREETQKIRSFYLSEGRYLTEVFDPSFDIDVEKKEVGVIWKIRESKIFELRFEGGYLSRELLSSQIENNETFPQWFVEDLVESIEDKLREDGYLDVQVVVEQEARSDDRVRVTFRTTLGKRYRLRKPEWVGGRDLNLLNKVYGELSSAGSGRPFHRRALTESIEKNLVIELQDRGFVDAQLRGLDFSIDETRFEVTPVIYLSEGDRFVVDRLELQGLEPWHDEIEELRDLRDVVREGSIVNLSRLTTAEDQAVRALIREGYLDAKNTRKVALGSSGALVQVEFSLGPRYRIANLFIKGAKRTKYDVIRRELVLEPGGYYRDELIQDSISNLLRLQILRSVEIKIFEKDPVAGEVFVQIEVSEAARFRFSLGPGYGTLDGVRGVFRGTYANIGGSGRRVSIYAKANRLESVVQDKKLPPDVVRPRNVPFIERRVSVEYFEPSLFGQRLDGRLTYTHRKEDENKYGIFSNSFGAALDYRLTRRWLFTTRYEVEFSDTFNEEVQTTSVARSRRIPDARKRLTSLGETVTADYLDDSFNPSLGYRGRGAVDLFDRYLGGDQNFWQVQIRNEFFAPLYRFSKTRKIGFAVSLRFGFSDTSRDTIDVPVEKRFFVGGESSIRGFSEKEVNPLSSDPSGSGYVTRYEGGKSLANFMTEINVPLVFDVDLLTFFDGGNVFETNTGFKPWDLRYSAGAGLRLNTPLGPIKAGYGFIINRRVIDGRREPVGSVYIGVGPI